jgi:hypothetical protein
LDSAIETALESVDGGFESFLKFGRPWDEKFWNIFWLFGILPDGVFIYQKSLLEYSLKGLGMEHVGMYITIIAIWKILWLFGIFTAIFGLFSFISLIFPAFLCCTN